jgi:hypothetical protein
MSSTHSIAICFIPKRYFFVYISYFLGGISLFGHVLVSLILVHVTKIFRQLCTSNSFYAICGLSTLVLKDGSHYLAYWIEINFCLIEFSQRTYC